MLFQNQFSFKISHFTRIFGNSSSISLCDTTAVVFNCFSQSLGCTSETTTSRCDRNMLERRNFWKSWSILKSGICEKTQIFRRVLQTPSRSELVISSHPSKSEHINRKRQTWFTKRTSTSLTNTHIKFEGTPRNNGERQLTKMSHPSRTKEASRQHSRVRPAGKHETGSKHDIGYLLNSSSTIAGPAVGYTPVDHRLSSLDSMDLATSSRHPSSKMKSKERPYECNICHFSFAQRSDRNKHIRTVHYRERPFVCEHCSQTFGEKGNL